MLRISGTAQTSAGLVRANNEDSAFVGPFCMLVADGVGGGAAGEVASATAAYAVTATALRRLGQDPAAALTAGFALAQAQVHAGAEQKLERHGMATTLTAVVTDGQRFVLAHLGDSRGYVSRGGGLTRVTRDHTYLQDLLDAGLEPPADRHPWRNVVLRSVNGRPDSVPDLIELDLAPGDRILLASDGLTDVVSEGSIARILRTCDDDEAVRQLVAAALANGGPDNVTCVLATVVDGDALPPEGQLYGAMREPGNVVDVEAIRMPSAS